MVYPCVALQVVLKIDEGVDQYIRVTFVNKGRNQRIRLEFSFGRISEPGIFVFDAVGEKTVSA